MNTVCYIDRPIKNQEDFDRLFYKQNYVLFVCADRSIYDETRRNAEVWAFNRCRIDCDCGYLYENDPRVSNQVVPFY